MDENMIYKMKKLIVLFTSLFMVVVILTGCSIGNEENEDENLNQVTIKWMIYGEESLDSDRVFAEFNKQLQKQIPNVTVEFEVIDKNDYKSEWDMKMATNSWVDIAWVGEELFEFTDEVKDGNFMAIDYLLSTNGEEIVETIPEDLWVMVSRGGNTFAVPIEGAMYREELGLIMQQSYVEEYPNKENLTSVFINRNVYIELEEYLAYLSSVNGMGTGISCTSLRKVADRGLEGVYGGDSPFVIRLEDSIPTIYNKYELVEYQEFFETMDRWYELGYIREDINEVINPEENEGIMNGSAIFVQEIGEEGIRCNDYVMDYEPFVIPICTQRYIGYETTRNSLVIPKSSKNPIQAMEVINLIYSEEGQDLYRLLVNGLEEEHYVVQEDGTILRNKDADDYLLYGLSQYTIGNVTSNYELSEGQFDRMIELNKNSVQSKLIGYDIDTRMVISSLTKVNLIVDEYIEPLSNGSEEDWERTYNEFIETMKKAGSEEIIKELQLQLDEFLSEEASD